MIDCSIPTCVARSHKTEILFVGDVITSNSANTVSVCYKRLCVSAMC